MPEDPDIGRLWLLAKIGQTFHVLPSEVARAIDHDPERIDLTCATLLGYANSKKVYDTAEGDDAKMKHLPESQQAMVRKNTFAIHKERLHHARHHVKRKVRDPECRLCQE